MKEEPLRKLGWSPAGPTRPDIPHYTKGDIECIDAIRAALGNDAFFDYCRGQVLKYAWRAKYKGEAVRDMRKAKTYIDFALEENNV